MHNVLQQKNSFSEVWDENVGARRAPSSVAAMAAGRNGGKRIEMNKELSASECRRVVSL